MPKESALSFRMMAWTFRMRDLLKPRRTVLEEAGLEPGDRVLDFGCGPGGYVLPAMKIIGPEGEYVALDVSRLAVKSVENLAFKHHLKNVRTVRSGLKTGLPDASVDVAFLFDVFHGLSKPEAVLAEIARVLKPDGRLCFSDHHLEEERTKAAVTGSGLFTLASRGEHLFTFVPATEQAA